jgi:hypothetical protein
VRRAEAEAAAGYAKAARIIAAYLLDRADQYETESPCWIALTDAAKSIVRGEAVEAFEAGEFEPALLARVDSWAKETT